MVTAIANHVNRANRRFGGSGECGFPLNRAANFTIFSQFSKPTILHFYVKIAFLHKNTKNRLLRKNHVFHEKRVFHKNTDLYKNLILGGVFTISTTTNPHTAVEQPFILMVETHLRPFVADADECTLWYTLV